jgi:hypothetical protein
LAKHEIRGSVTIEIAERGRLVKPAGDRQRPAKHERGCRCTSNILEPVDARRLLRLRVELVREQQIQVAVAIEVNDRGNALAADIDDRQQALRPNGPRA